MKESTDGGIRNGTPVQTEHFVQSLDINNINFTNNNKLSLDYYVGKAKLIWFSVGNLVI